MIVGFFDFSETLSSLAKSAGRTVWELDQGAEASPSDGGPVANGREASVVTSTSESAASTAQSAIRNDALGVIKSPSGKIHETSKTPDQNKNGEPCGPPPWKYESEYLDD
jgi:hypothetical protein